MPEAHWLVSYTQLCSITYLKEQTLFISLAGQDRKKCLSGVTVPNRTTLFALILHNRRCSLYRYDEHADEHESEVRYMAQLSGSVKWFNNVKGYGFIGHDGGPDVFCHYSSIQHDGYKSLKEGDLVQFDIVQGDKGPQTDKVTRQAENGPSSSNSDMKSHRYLK